MRIGHAHDNAGPLAPDWVDVAPVKDGSAKPYRLWRKLLPVVRLLARLWPWLAVPTAAAVVIVWLLVTALAFDQPVIALLFAIAVPAAVIAVVPRVRVFYRGFPVAAAVAFYELFTWPYLCGLAGFVQAANGRLTFAELTGVEFKDSVLRPKVVQLDVVPVLQHDRSTWDRYEDRVARYHKAATSFWQPSPTGNGMRITVRRDMLPRSVQPGIDIPHDRIGRQLANGVRIPLDEVYLGLAADNSDITWLPDESGRGSVFIGGRKGGGKGQIIKAILTHGLAAERGWRFTVCNPKRIGEFNWLTGHAVVEKEPAAMFAAIRAFRVEMERRADVLDEVFGAASYLDVPLEALDAYDMGCRWCLIIDELVVFASLRGVVAPPPKPEGHKGQWRPVDPYQQVHADLQAITAMDRAMGMSSIVATQHPIAEHLGPFGSTLKSNLAGKIGTGYLEPEGAAALFGKSQGTTIADVLRAGIPGRQVFEGLATTEHGRWMLGQGVHITNPTVFLPAHSWFRPRDFATELGLNTPTVVDLEQHRAASGGRGAA